MVWKARVVLCRSDGCRGGLVLLGTAMSWWLLVVVDVVGLEAPGL